MKKNNAAFLWDESYLWGLMAFNALKHLDLPFDLIKAEDIKSGVLENYRMLFVPGGWASNKSKALGDSGIHAIRDFVEQGGNYLGFCGGAGLATKAKGGIGLLNVKRRPTKERVPSFSGRINLNLIQHPIWETGSAANIYHAWWPSQLIVEDEDVKILATYGEALSDAFSSDLNVGDVEGKNDWKELEEIYKIKLDPQRLLNEPAVIEGRYGKGNVVLSLVHFDTPDDINGQEVLVNLWDYLAGYDSKNRKQKAKRVPVEVTHELPLRVTDLIELGERNFLWFWRNSMLLQWRRGVRGLEYNTLYIMMKEIELRGVSQHAEKIEWINDMLLPFIEKAKRLLILERLALQKGHITYSKCDDPEIELIRTELFSNTKSYGGMFKDLIDEVDSMLYSLIRNA